MQGTILRGDGANCYLVVQMTTDDFIKYTEAHPELFVNYCEVLISDTGMIMYGASHQETLVTMYCTKYECSREELNERIPPQYNLDVVTWMCRKLNYPILVRYFMWEGVKPPNKLQQVALDKLTNAHLIDISEHHILRDDYLYENYYK